MLRRICVVFDAATLLSCAETYLTSFARLFVSLLVAFSYPLQCHPARRCIITLISSIKHTHYPADDDQQALAGSSPSSSTSAENEAAQAANESLMYNIITVRTIEIIQMLCCSLQKSVLCFTKGYIPTLLTHAGLLLGIVATACYNCERFGSTAVTCGGNWLHHRVVYLAWLLVLHSFRRRGTCVEA